MLQVIPSASTPPSGPGWPSGLSLVRKDGRPLRILIVEDEQLVALDLASLIEQYGGVALGTAASAEAAIRMASTLRPDVVLMDIRLAPGDGIAAARAIRSEVPAAIVYVTGNTDPVTMQRIAQDGSWPVLMKPVPVFELCEAIGAAHRRQQGE